MGRHWLVPPVARLVTEMSTVSAEAVIPIIHSGVFQVGDDVMMGKECLTIGDLTEGVSTITLGVSRAQRGTTARRHLRGARLSGIPHALVATSPGGGTTWDYTVRWGKVLSGFLTTTSPGGDGELTFTVVDYETGGGLSAACDRGSEIYVADGDGFAGRYWTGIVESPEILRRGRSGAYEVTITAHGISVLATDRIYETSTIYAKDNPIYVGLKHARDNLVTDIDPTDNTRITAGLNNLLVNSQNMIGKTAMEVWNQQVGLGDGTEGDQILWHVLTRDSDGQYVLEVKLRPAAPSYVVAKDQLEPGWKLRWARSDIRNRVVVQYAGGIAVAEDAGSIADLRATRAMFVDAANQIDSHGTALYAAKAILSRFKDGLATGDGFMVRWPNVVTDAVTTDPIDLWRIRAGTAITLNGIDPGNATLPVGDEFVRTTKWDLVKHTLSWQTERLRTPANVLGQLIKHDSQRLDSSIHQPPANSGAVVPNANAAYPGVEAKTPRLGTDNRVGYSQLAKGLDKVPAVALIGSKATDATNVTAGEQASIPVTWPSKLTKVYIQRTDPSDTAVGTVSVSVGKMAPADWPTPTEIMQVDIAGDYGDADGYDVPADTKLEAGEEIVFTVLGSPTPVATTYLRAWAYMIRSAAELAIPDDPGAPGLSSTSAGGSGVNPIINVETNKDARVQIEYGTTTDYGSFSLVSEVIGTEHEIPLFGLAPGQTYHYRVLMESIQLESGTSADFSFST